MGLFVIFKERWTYVSLASLELNIGKILPMKTGYDLIKSEEDLRKLAQVCKQVIFLRFHIN